MGYYQRLNWNRRPERLEGTLRVRCHWRVSTCTWRCNHLLACPSPCFRIRLRRLWEQPVSARWWTWHGRRHAAAAALLLAESANASVAEAVARRARRAAGRPTAWSRRHFGTMLSTSGFFSVGVSRKNLLACKHRGEALSLLLSTKKCLSSGERGTSLPSSSPPIIVSQSASQSVSHECVSQSTRYVTEVGRSVP